MTKYYFEGFCDHCDYFDTERCKSCKGSRNLVGKLIGKPTNYKPMGR